MISVIILTKNEEADIGGCLDSVRWSDDVHVFDSLSTDRTVELAESLGAHVTKRAFDGYASQRNAALAGVMFRYEWILILDADERIPSALAREMEEAVRNAPESIGGFRIRRRDYLLGTWLKRAQISPFYIRLVRRGKACYEREINEVIKVEGGVIDLAEHFDHFPFSKGFAQWLDKHNRYSTMEAERWLEEQAGKVRFSWGRALFSKDFSERRFHQKGLFYRFPCRPLLKWLYMVVWRRAFLDGKAGIAYATLQSIYEYFIVLKANEMQSIESSKSR